MTVRGEYVERVLYPGDYVAVVGDTEAEPVWIYQIDAIYENDIKITWMVQRGKKNKYWRRTDFTERRAIESEILTAKMIWSFALPESGRLAKKDIKRLIAHDHAWKTTEAFLSPEKKEEKKEQKSGIKRKASRLPKGKKKRHR